MRHPRVDSTGGYPAIAKFTHQFAYARPVGRHVNRNGRVQINETTLAMKELDFTRMAAIGIRNRYAGQNKSEHSAQQHSSEAGLVAMAGQEAEPAVSKCSYTIAACLGLLHWQLPQLDHRANRFVAALELDNHHPITRECRSKSA